MNSTEERVWDAKELSATVIPMLSLLIKDHKPVGEDGMPASRPVCGAAKSINGELSEYLSIVLESMIATMETEEVISGEELRATIDQVSRILSQRDEPRYGYCLGSLDVKALYPSLNIKECGEICAKRFL